jgi:N-hydroxyarylamine O-acetyltransferase
VDVLAYLLRLGLDAPGEPSVAGLRALHAAHVEKIAYEALDIQLGRVTSIDPLDSVARVTERRRGGYCYHLNGAFSMLLRALGYDVRWRRVGVQLRADLVPPGPARANHLGLTVHGLPDEESPSGDWLVDVGLGDALHEPLPLRAGDYRQGPLRFQLRPSQLVPGGWRFEHDPQGSFIGMDFGLREATVADFTERHVLLSTEPDSGFVRTCAVQRRDRTGLDLLTGCVLRRIGDDARPLRIIEDQDEWFAVLRDVFGLDPTDLDEADRAALWERVQATHQAWLTAAG